MPPRNLLLCFDAFGTLFKPRAPIMQQYGDVARSYGLGGFTNEDVGKAFKDGLFEAFKRESKQNPNYGKAKGLNSEIWWTNIITNTFEPLIPSGQAIPNGMVHTLLHRFWCDEGYTLFSDVRPLLKTIREAHQADNTQVVIGVITNSDDRVPDILASFGLKVSPLRYGTTMSSETIAGKQFDIDFSVMSYDVGHEKPDQRIFLAAEDMLRATLKAQDSTTEHDPSRWRKVYVGDEYDKDVVGALSADWNAVLIDRETPGDQNNLEWLANEPAGNLHEVFKVAKAVGFNSLEQLSLWLSPKP